MSSDCETQKNLRSTRWHAGSTLVIGISYLTLALTWPTTLFGYIADQKIVFDWYIGYLDIHIAIHLPTILGKVCITPTAPVPT